MPTSAATSSTPLVSTVQWLTLAVAAVMPIVVALATSVLTRRRSLREMRDREVVRVFEELCAAITAFGTAAYRGQGGFEYWLALQCKLAVARIHSGPQLIQYLESFGKMSHRLFDACETRRAAVLSGGDGVEEEERVEEEATKLLVLLENMTDSVADQLGPVYTASNSWRDDWAIRFAYVVLKAKERLMLERLAPTKHTAKTTVNHPDDTNPSEER